jgi:nitronate monooxygenase
MAGAVSTGAAIRAAEILGADLAYLGTRFIA